MGRFLDCKMRKNEQETARRNESVALLTLKNIRSFVCASSFVLAAWLGLTFVSKVSPHRYPSQADDKARTSGVEAGKETLTASVGPQKEDAAQAVTR